MWVGETYMCDASSATMGLTSDVSWTTSGGYLSLSGSGFYRYVTVTQYFSGSATVKCSWKYRLYSGDKWKSQSRTWTISCYDNPASIQPTELTLSPGEMAYVGYSHQYSNSYVSAANPYFNSSNSNIATVSGSGLVTAIAPGTTYITLYSKVSKTSPYCTVTVKPIEPESVSIPADIDLVAGETKQLSTKISPSNATITSAFWESDNTSIVSVNSSGLLTAIKHGIAKVRCLINGTLYFNYATVNVSKATLTLTASKDSGLTEKGATVKLTANNSAATIYYTIDGTTPSVNSFVYTSPITVDKNITLKAIACHEDYNTSQVLTKKYEVTGLKITETYPYAEQTTSDCIIPSITFNEPITKGVSFDRIEVLSKSVNVLKGAIIKENTLFLITDQTSIDEHVRLKLILPERSIQSIISREDNIAFEMSWNMTNHSSQYISCATDIYTGGRNTSSLLTSTGYLHYWGAFPSDGGGWMYPYFWDKEMDYDVASSCNSDEAVAYIDTSGNLWMWGYNNWSCIGDGGQKKYYNRTEPYKVMDNIKEVSIGGSECHTMALDNDGNLYVWGSNYYNQLGISNLKSAKVPQLRMSGIKHIYAGDRGSYVIKEDDSLWFWGSFYKNGTLKTYASPTKIMDNVIMVSSYYEDSPCVIKSDNTLWICDFNLSATKVADGIKYVTGSSECGFYIKTDGSLWGWGRNDHGQIGNGIRNERQYTGIREAVKVMDNVTKVSIKWDYTLALTEDGNVWGWGRNEYGNIDPSNCKKSGESHSVKHDILTPMLIWESVRKPQIDSIDLLSSNVTMAMGEVLPIQLRVNPADAFYENIRWQSLDESIATVSQRGFITGVSEGQTEILVTVTADGGEQFIQKCKVIVTTSTNINEVNASDYHIHVNNGILHIDNIPIGTHIGVFDSYGMKLYNSNAKAQNINIPIRKEGVIIVKTGDRTTKFIIDK